MVVQEIHYVSLCGWLLYIDRDFIKGLTAFMPRRLAAVIAATGGNEFEA